MPIASRTTAEYFCTVDATSTSTNPSKDKPILLKAASRTTFRKTDPDPLKGISNPF